ncbi:Beige/BEACH domain containing protein [Trichomonas vaginalis G3]|uniref:Beige/BEACH domain containing protein n=1 Tax=Trichomonas vaginalis (strain ATCC PRA-98 / G3) TaxID=412133 RepID=A2DAC6_TRIV3|nr:beige/BEACH-related family [Trichomonas vaginalis G3]EAY22774.1 Beige/BEACH domain containing protein [Trichomonas vaginalis G3]KAI5525585.1 beige/BEACH-related family [Trichomonas vaginalis G3]|eukprot:XP_001583760.1 Beige/BEACH domain containing protein [Trichomonas vaginalis G3]
MNFRFLEFFKDPFFEILEFSIPKNIEELITNQDLLRIAELNPLPNINKAEIHAARLRFQEIHSYTTAMHMVEYLFPFFPESLEKINSLDFLDANEQLFCTAFILYSYNTWITLHEKTSSCDYLALLMKSLCKFINTSHLKLLKFAVVYLYAIYLTNGQYSDIESVFEFIEIVVNDDPSISRAVYYLYAQTLDKITDRNALTLTKFEKKLVNSFLKLIERTKNSDSQDAAFIIMKSISNPFFHLDFDTSEIFAHLSEQFNEAMASEFAVLSARSIIKVIEENDWDFPFLSDPIAERIDYKRSIVPVSFVFPKQQTFPDGFQITNPNIFTTDHVSNLECFSGLSTIIEYIAINMRNNSNIMELFVRFLSENLPFSTKYYFSLNFLVYTCNLLSRCTTNEHSFVKYFPIEKIFAPGIYCTIENCQNNILYEHTNQMRNAVFHIIIKEGFEAFDKFLGSLLTTPMIFAESMYRLSHYNQEIMKWVQSGPEFSKSISDFLLNLAIIRKDNITEANIAITSIFRSLLFFFSNPEIHSFFFQDSYFTSCFLSYIFDPNLVSFILNQVKVYMSTCDLSHSELGRSLTNIIGILCIGFPQKENVILVSKIIKIIHDVLLQKQTEVMTFESILTTVRVSALSHLSNTEECRQCFKSCIDLFIVSSKIVTLHNEDIIYFEEGYTKTFSADQYLSLFPKFVQLLAGEVRTNTEPNFIIKEPLVLRIMFNIYERYNQIPEICKYFDKICKFSKENCVICHQSEFDLFLVDKIIKYWTQKDERNTIVALFDLFSTIAEHISSAAVVYRYISLLCPIDNKLPPFYSMALDKLLVMFELIFKEPPKLISLQKKSKKKVTQTFIIGDEISFSFWMKVKKIEKDYYPLIFSCSDLKKHNFSLFVNSKSLSIGSEDSAFASLPYLQEKSWNFILVRILNSEIVELTINGNMSETIKLKENMKIQGETKFIFGGEISYSFTPKKPYVLGPFGVFNELKTFNISELETHGYIYMRRINAKPIMIYNEKLSKKKNNFISVLTTVCHVDIILPIFKNLALTYDDGNLCENHITYASELLVNFLLWSDDSENSCQNAFSIIGYLLESVDISYFSYEFYEHFFNILGTINYKPLKTEIIREILMNFSIWTRIQPSEQLLVYSHWSQFLINIYSENVFSFTNFSVFLSEILIYFRSKTDDNSLNGFTICKPSSEISLVEIRLILFQILQLFASHEFTYDEYLLLISSARAQNGTELFYELLKLILSLVNSQPSPLAKIQNHDLIFPLISLLKDADTYAVQGIVNIINNIYKNKIVSKPEISNCVNMMIRLTPKSAFNSDLAKYILFMLNYSKDFYPFFFWCLYNLKEFDQELFENGINLLQKKNISDFWYFIFLTKSDNDYLLETIISKYPENIKFSYINYLFTCEMLHLDTRKMEKFFISKLTDYLIEKNVSISDEAIVSKYLDIVEYFFFLNRKSLINKTLSDIFKLSEFKENFVENDEIIKEKDENNDVHERIFDVKNIQNNYFGLYLENDGKWNDYDIATKVIKLLAPVYQISHKILILLIYFVINYKETEGKDEYLKILAKISSISGLNPREKDIIDLINPKITEKTEEQIESFQRTVQDIGSNFVPLFNQILDEKKNSCKETINFIQKFVTFSIESTNDLWINYKKRFVEEWKNRKMITEKQWRYIWSILTIQKGPWEKENDKILHYKRDTTLCNYIPCKMKRNRNFDIHDDASFARDSGVSPQRNSMKKFSLKNFQNMTQQIPKEKIVIESSCVILTNTGEKHATISLLNTTVLFSHEKIPFTNFVYKDIVLLLPQLHLHLNTALEIFLENGKSLFIVFPTPEITKQFLRVFDQKLSENAKIETQKFLSNQTTKDWLDHKISNFEYILYLNMKSSRSFSVNSQYPIYPWVISNYETENLDLNDVKNYRNLSIPIGAVDEERLNDLKSGYEELEAMDPPGHLYSAGPICSLVLYLYLVRIEPFTTMHIEMQGGKFDQSERIFFSIPDLFRSVCHNRNDYRELIPEFYFMPEFLLNKDKFDLGKCANETGDVILPKWAKSPIDFVYQLRKALESDYVSQNLNEWIDLIFGYKQKSLEFNNLYKRELYEDIWTPELIQDQEQRGQIEAAKNYLGQIPHKLFTKPHPKREKISSQNLNSCKIAETKINSLYVNCIDGKMFYIIDSNNKCICYNSKTGERNEKYLEFDIKKVQNFLLFGSHRVICNIDKESYVIDIKTAEVMKLENHIKCANGNDLYLITISDENTLSFFDENTTLIKSYPIYRESARSCFVSSEFHLAVTAVNDGSIVLHSLEREINVTSMELGDFIPHQVIVTPYWGFICCFVSPKRCEKTVKTIVYLFSVNGEKIRETELSYEINNICSFRSRKGFDYIAISNSRGNVLVAEAFYLNFQKVELKRFARIVSISYDEDEQNLVCFTDNGEILYTPFSPN